MTALAKHHGCNPVRIRTERCVVRFKCGVASFSCRSEALRAANKQRTRYNEAVKKSDAEEEAGAAEQVSH